MNNFYFSFHGDLEVMPAFAKLLSTIKPHPICAIITNATFELSEHDKYSVVIEIEGLKIKGVVSVEDLNNRFERIVEAYSLPLNTTGS